MVARTIGGRVVSQPQPARRIALDVIMAVRESDAYANLLLPVRLGRAKLSEADAGLATELTYGTLRMQGYYDRIIAMAAGRDVAKIDPPILDVLRLACHQLLSMRVAQHAAVDESVELAKTVGSNSAVGFVNGVLRTITRTDAETWRERVLAAAASGEEALALEYSHPVWVTRAFRQVLVAEGREAELEALARGRQRGPARFDRGPAWSCDRGRSWMPTPPEFSPVGSCSMGATRSKLPSVREGRARVQDEGSQLAALALSRVRADRAGGALARSVRRPGWQGGAPRGGGRSRRRDSRRERTRARARGTRAQGSRGVRPRARGVGARRHDRRRVIPRAVRPHPARRAVHGARRAAASTRGALAQAAE